MVDRDVRFEALSALLGSPVKPVDSLPNKTTGPVMTPDDLLIAAILGNETLIRKLAFKLRNESHESSVVVKTDRLELNDDESKNHEDSLSRVLDEILHLKDEFFIDESEFFDPPYDYDFTGHSTSESCKRGGEPYERPYGWYRMALKVQDKYPDGNTWLGPDGWRKESAPGEWPVSFHGTSLERAKGIIRSHYKAGSGDVHGRGIYSTPKLSVATSPFYSKTFQSQKNGKTYRVVMQNRINPEERQICKEKEDYWLIPVPEGTSAVKEREIVERSIRPYGILIQEMKEDRDENNWNCILS